MRRFLFTVLLLPIASALLAQAPPTRVEREELQDPQTGSLPSTASYRGTEASTQELSPTPSMREAAAAPEPPAGSIEEATYYNDAQVGGPGNQPAVSNRAPNDAYEVPNAPTSTPSYPQLDDADSRVDELEDATILRSPTGITPDPASTRPSAPAQRRTFPQPD